MTHILFVDSVTGVQLEPEYDLRLSRRKQEDVSRSRAGRRYVYQWSTHDAIRFSVSFVDSSTQCIVNSWWGANTELKFAELGGTDITSVQLTNRQKPIDRFVKPFDDLYRGIIELETY